MTLAFCVKVCMSLATSTKFSGVEGENCFCFDTLINSDPLTNKHCHTKCPGDKSVLCGGHGAMSVTNLEENSVHEVLVLYGGYDNPKFEVINKNGDVCIADTIPGICSHFSHVYILLYYTKIIFAEPPEKIKYAGYTWRKDRYFFICGGCVIDDTDQCTYTDNCYMLDLAIGKKKVNS